jgi:tetratricopeptide (TPR) repeat protein
LWKSWANIDGDKKKNLAGLLVILAKSVSLFLSYSGRWDEYIQINEKAYQAAKTLENIEYIGWRAFDIAWMNYKRAHTKEAHEWLEKCTQAWNRGGTRGERASALRLKGLLAQQAKKYSLAEELLQESLNIRRELQATKEVAYALSSLGQLALEMQNYAKAKLCFDEALGLNEQTNDLSIQASLSDYSGKLALHHSQWDIAQTWFEQAISLARDVSRVELIGRGKYGLAQVWEAKNQKDNALNAALEALKVYERLQLSDLDSVKALVVRLQSTGT